MSSLFTKILAWFLVTATLTAIAIGVTTALFFAEPQPRQVPFAMLVGLQFEQAKEAYEQGGREAL